MSKDKSIIFWASLLAVTFVTPVALLRADDATTATPDGYRIVPVKVDGHTVPIQVRDSSNPYKNVASGKPTPGHYDPRSINFSAESPMAAKKFDAPGFAPTQPGTNVQNQSFLTKTYTEDAAQNFPDSQKKAQFSSNNSYRKATTDFNKSFDTSKADADQNRTALLAKADTDDQNRSAFLNAKPVETTESNFASKTFQGPEADAIHKHLSKTSDGKIAISELPDRALTIDEVRDLINHGFKPNTDVKPETPSKPLNDPDYKPQPLRISPAEGDDDKNDAVPPPGTMASPPPPENAEPLPRH